jgi:hypothetical protein
MRATNKASKVPGADRERSAAFEAILEPAAGMLLGDDHATPWDEPPHDWGRRGYGAHRVRRLYRRELLFGTW